MGGGWGRKDRCSRSSSRSEVGQRYTTELIQKVCHKCVHIGQVVELLSYLSQERYHGFKTHTKVYRASSRIVYTSRLLNGGEFRSPRT